VTTTEHGTWVAPASRVTWTPPGFDHSHRFYGDTDARLLAVPADECHELVPRPSVFAVSPLVREALLALTGRSGRSPDAERALADESRFAVCFWAQEFFSVDARGATLAAIFTALRPDGLLLMQELVPPATTQDEAAVRHRLDALFYRQHNVVFDFSAEALAAEATAAGFRDAHIVNSPVGRLVLARRPSL